MIYVISATFSVVPMLIYLIIIWKMDKYDREPLSLVLLNYLWGALGAVILTFIFGVLLNNVIGYMTGMQSTRFFDTIIAAPFIEECMKGVFLLFTMTNRKFDNMTDGMVYGGAVGLGFGTTENFLYYITYGSSLNDLVFLIIVRTFFSAVMHCVATAVFGAFLAYVKFRKGIKRFLLPLTGLLLAIIVHVTWNTSVSFNNTAFSGFISMIITITVFIFVFIMSVYNDRKIIYDELTGEAENGVIPVEHLVILNSGERNKEGWIDNSRRKAYIHAATTLAFRKMQYKYASGAEKYLCEREMEYNRQLIHDILTKNSLPDE
jgi:RsiW-degrading membrane proteinase PrsW (M82 family)